MKFYFLSVLVVFVFKLSSFCWLCEEAQCVYLRLHLDWKPYYFYSSCFKLGMVLFPKRLLVVSGDIFACHKTWQGEVGCYWHLLDADQNAANIPQCTGQPTTELSSHKCQ